MGYLVVILTCAFGIYYLVRGLSAVGVNVLPADGQLQFVGGQASLAALLNALLAAMLGAVGFRYGRTPVEAGLYLVGAVALVACSVYSFRQGRFVLFDSSSRSRTRGWAQIGAGAVLIVLTIGAIVLAVVSAGVT